MINEFDKKIILKYAQKYGLAKVILFGSSVEKTGWFCMNSVKEKIYAEMENITKVLIELEKVKDRSNKELVVLVGIGAYLQNIYAGIENILKQLLLSKNIKIKEIERCLSIQG